jgi:CheY-like chemotaxis protein
LAADDDARQTQELVSNIRKLVGPDNKQQICDVAYNGQQLVEIYTRRLRLAESSGWTIYPYQFVVADVHMPMNSGIQSAFKIK